MRSRVVRYGFFVILVVYALVRVFWLLADEGGRLMGTPWAQAALKAALWIPSCALVLTLAHRASPRPLWRELGLDRGLRAGITFGVLATLPMAFAVLIAGPAPSFIGGIAASAVVDPIAETILFTGFLFGQLHRRAQWPLALAITASAMMFGLAHLEGFLVVFLRWLPAFAAIAAAGALFTWVAHRWGSLWPAIALHGGVNFWWTLSGEASDTERFFQLHITPVAAAHALSMATALAVTAWWTRRRRPGLATGEPAYDFTRTV